MTSTRQHLAHLLKYYPRRPRAPSLIKSRFFRSTTIYLLSYIFIFLKFLICIHAGASTVPPRGLASGPKPCGGKKEPHVCIEIGTHATLFLWSKWLVAWITGACAQRRRRRTTSHNMAAIQLIPSHAVLDYSIYL